MDVLLEERAVGRLAVDVALLDVNLVLVQKTSGIAARRSGGLPVEDGLHGSILRLTRRFNTESTEGTESTEATR